MKVVGVTGGIGSGKSTVVNAFIDLGVPAFIADEQAKKIVQSSVDVQNQIIDLLGKEAFINGRYNRKFVSSKIFSNATLRAQLNEIIHPAVAKAFFKWKAENVSFLYGIYESAILFETGTHIRCDFVILVTASRKDRIERLMKRDDTTRDQILKRMRSQWSDTKKRTMSNLELKNKILSKTVKKINKIDIYFKKMWN